MPARQYSMQGGFPGSGASFDHHVGGRIRELAGTRLADQYTVYPHDPRKSPRPLWRPKSDLGDAPIILESNCSLEEVMTYPKSTVQRVLDYLDESCSVRDADVPEKLPLIR